LNFIEARIGHSLVTLESICHSIFVGINASPPNILASIMVPSASSNFEPNLLTHKYLPSFCCMIGSSIVYNLIIICIFTAAPDPWYLCL